MKRIVTSLLMIAYMAGAIGLSFSFHYCGGEFHAICFTEDTEKDCCGTKEKSDGCCEDKVISAKCAESHAPAYATFAPKVFTEFLPAPVYPGFNLRMQAYDYAAPLVQKGHSPPFLDHVPIYLQHRVLRI
jgi:hypothetical protein